jgi:hypothetical protein
MISESGENLVFICCLPRSGSTLLSAILGNHPDVCSPPEPWVLLRLAEVYGEPAEGKIYDDHVASKAVRDFLDHDDFVASARSFAVTAYNRRLTRGGHRILVDKTPRYYHILGFVRELFPRAKMIWLRRNPLDVAASYKVSCKGLNYLTGKTLDPISFDFSVGLPNLPFLRSRPPTTSRSNTRSWLARRKPKDGGSPFCGCSSTPLCWS